MIIAKLSNFFYFDHPFHTKDGIFIPFCMNYQPICRHRNECIHRAISCEIKINFGEPFFYVTTGDWTTLMLIFILFYLFLVEKLVKEVIRLGQSFKGITSTNKCELCRWAKVRAWAWATWQLRKDPKRNVWSVVFFLQPFPYSMPSTDTLALVNSEKQFSEVCFINFCSFSSALGAYISYWNYILGLYNSVRIRRVKWVRARIRARVRVTWQWMGRSFLLCSSGYPSLSQPLPDHDMNRPDLFIIFFFF